MNSNWLIKVAMFVHGEGDHVIAYKSHVFLIDPHKQDLDNPVVRQMANFLGTNTIDLMKTYGDTWDYLSHLKDMRPDILQGYIHDNSLVLQSSDFQHRSGSRLLQNIVKSLGLRNVEYNNEYNSYDNISSEQLKGSIPKNLYHGTTSEYAYRILRFGLQPGEATTNYPGLGPHNDISHDEVVFLTEDIEKAAYHATNAVNQQGGFPVVFEFNIPDPSKLVSDYDVESMYDEEYEGNIYNNTYKAPVTEFSSKIKEPPFDFSKKIGVFGYKGRIPSNFITDILIQSEEGYFYGYNSDKWVNVTQEQLQSALDFQDPMMYNYEPEGEDEEEYEYENDRYASSWFTRLVKVSNMPQNINKNPTEERIFQFIREACLEIERMTGHRPTARVAGGWVRDHFLNKESKDIDITVDMPGTEFAQYLYSIANNPEIVSQATSTEARPDQIKNLTVAFLKIFGEDIEILPLRGKEVYEYGNRNPISTEKATPQEDAYRRDLTINSMFYNINEDSVEDFTGQGYQDLMSMTLRTPTRPGQDPYSEALRILHEDPLRLLRIVRFNSRYTNSQIAPEVLEAMKDPEIQHQLVRRLYGDTTGGIVPERTADELRKIMSGEQPEEAIRVMLDTGLLQQMLLLPKEYRPLHMDQKSKYHRLTVIDHTLEVLKNVNNLSQEFGLTNKQRMLMNLTALFHDLGKLDVRSHKKKRKGRMGYSGDPNNPNRLTHQQASQERWDAFSKALKLSDEESSVVSDAVLNHMNPHEHVKSQSPPSDKQLRKYLRKNPAWVFQYIHAMADAMSKNTPSNPEAAVLYRNNLERLRSLAPTADQFGNIPPQQDLLKGPEIIQIVGLPPKPPAGIIKGYIEVVKELIRDEQDNNPTLDPQSASNMVANLRDMGQFGQGVLAPYFSI